MGSRVRLSRKKRELGLCRSLDLWVREAREEEGGREGDKRSRQTRRHRQDAPGPLLSELPRVIIS